MKHFLVLFVFLLPAAVMAQGPWYCTDSTLCKTGVEGMTYGKFLNLSYTLVPDFNFRKAESESQSDLSVRRLSEFKGNVKLPLLLKDKFKILAGISYAQEDYKYKRRDITNSGFDEALDDKNLKSASINFFFLRPLRGNKYIAARWGNSFNGDYGGVVKPAFRYYSTNLTFMAVFKKEQKIELGGGFIASYGIRGTFSGLPVLLYNHTFNSKLGIETLLPAEANLRWNISKKSVMYTGFEFDASSYRIDGEGLSANPDEPVLLQKTTVKVGTSIEQEILPAVGLGFAMGYMRTLGIDLTLVNPDEELVQIAPDNSVYFKISLFITPPQKLLDKFNKRDESAPQ